MEMIKINETPVRTSRNFGSNNISINKKIPKTINKFDNLRVKKESSKIKVESEVEEYKLTYGLGSKLEEHNSKNANSKNKILIDSKMHQEISLEFEMNKENLNLVEQVEIVANEGTKATLILKYETLENIEAFHNGKVKILAKKGATLNVIVVNLMNIQSNNFLAIENKLEDEAKVKYTIVDFGGKNSITNYYSNISGKLAENSIDTIYLGRENQLLDLNYIAELRGESSKVNIEVQGALKDEANKHFKGTIDFKKGSKKAKGNENEACMLLSNKAKSLAVPMLLCSEEDVEGNHSTSSGKLEEKEMFYIMSRGFEPNEAMKLMVRAKFNKILENIKNAELKEQIINEIDKRLD